MLEHVPAWLGQALSGLRAGADKLVVANPHLVAAAPAIDLSSPAFAEGARLPERFTADGFGVSPPLRWGTPPIGTALMALIVEDPDAPAPQPLVHAIVWGLPPASGGLAEGDIGEGGADWKVGRNSYLKQGWLPPDPPTGHGEHRYAFQLFALGEGVGDPGAAPGRDALVSAMTGRVLAAGLLTGTYARGTPAEAGMGAPVPA